MNIKINPIPDGYLYSLRYSYYTLLYKYIFYSNRNPEVNIKAITSLLILTVSSGSTIRKTLFYKS